MADVPEIKSTDPHEMLGIGRRHLAVKDYSNAVTVLGEACELLSKQYGQQADECGEAYFWYGKALLGLAREECGVLGNVFPGNEENQEDEEDEEDNDESAEDGNNDDGEKDESENKTENVDKPIEDKEMKDAKNGESNDDSNTENKNNVDNKMEAEPVAGSSSGAGTSSADGEAVDNEDEDEVENLQIAWEVFELARDVFIKRGDNGKKELADVYMHLGEVSLESEAYDKASSDMGKGLELYKELYKPDDRRIAETHYQIGLSHSLCSRFDDAIENFKSAAEILETRIKNLQQPSAATEDVDIKNRIASDPFYSIDGEIKELTELLPEIKEKINDMIDYKAETMQSIRKSLGFGNTNGEFPSSSTNGSSSSKPPVEKKASDISHLVKRKRKADDDPSEQPVPIKKQAN